METVGSLSSRSAWCCNARRREHLAAYSTAAFFSTATVHRFLLLADSASSLASSAGMSSDRGFLVAFFAAAARIRRVVGHDEGREEGEGRAWEGLGEMEGK